MSIVFKQVIATLVLAGLFGIVFLLRTPNPSGGEALSEQKALERYGFVLREESKKLGINFTHQGSALFATWFTYGTDGSGMWLVMSDARKGAGETFTGNLYRTTGPAFNAVPFNPAMVQVTQVGTGTFTFTDANTGTFSYTVNGISQTKNIIRQVYSSPVSVCK